MTATVLIRVSPEVRLALREAGTKDQTYDDIIRGLLERKRRSSK